MISEAAITGKPIYIADIPARKKDQRFKMFREVFNRLNITKNLNEKQLKKLNINIDLI